MGLISSSRGITALVPVEVSMNFGLFQHPADLQLDQNIAETSERSVAPWQRVSRPSRIWCAWGRTPGRWCTGAFHGLSNWSWGGTDRGRRHGPLRRI